MPFFLFRSPRARHPIVRILFALLGVAVLGAIVLFGLFAALALLLVGGVSYLLRQLGARPGNPAPQPQAARAEPTPDGVLEGEFVVIREHASRLQR